MAVVVHMTIWYGPSHPHNVGTEHIESSPTRRTSRAPTAERSEVFGDSDEGRGACYLEPLARRTSAGLTKGGVLVSCIAVDPVGRFSRPFFSATRATLLRKASYACCSRSGDTSSMHRHGHILPLHQQKKKKNRSVSERGAELRPRVAKTTSIKRGYPLGR